MAHRHPSGQIVMEAVLVIAFLMTVFLLIAGHLSVMKQKFEKADMTKEGTHGYQRFHRKK
jgi:hypothetical protein